MDTDFKYPSLLCALSILLAAALQTTRNVGQCPTWWPPCRI